MNIIEFRLRAADMLRAISFIEGDTGCLSIQDRHQLHLLADKLFEASVPSGYSTKDNCQHGVPILLTCYACEMMTAEMDVRSGRSKEDSRACVETLITGSSTRQSPEGGIDKTSDV